MAVAKTIMLVVRFLLKAAEVYDSVRKRNKAENRAEREKEIEDAIRSDSVRAAERLYGRDEHGS